MSCVEFYRSTYSLSSSSSSERCGVCIADFEEGDLCAEHLATAEKTHKYHLQCIQIWFAKEEGYSCPECRALVWNRTEFLFNVGMEMRSQDFERVAALGNVAAMNKIFDKGVYLYSLASALSEAMDRKDEAVLSTITKLNSEVAFVFLGEAEIRASFARGDRPSLIIAHLTLYRAIVDNRLGVMQVFLEDGRTIPEDFRTYCIQTARDHRRLEALRELLIHNSHTPCSSALFSEVWRSFRQWDMEAAWVLSKNQTTAICSGLAACASIPFELGLSLCSQLSHSCEFYFPGIFVAGAVVLTAIEARLILAHLYCEESLRNAP